MQPSEVNYNCRLRNESTAPSTHNKNDGDFGLLVACKLQLSSEVIKWKTESLRLQKEKEAAQLLNKELDTTITDLKSKLLKAEEENKRLKTKKILMNDERVNNIERLAQSLNKCHSFPMIDNSNASNINHLRTSDFSNSLTGDTQQEDWKEVSARMIMQMQQEMKEVQTMSLCINSCLNKTNSEDTPSDSDCTDDLENSMSTLLSNTKSLKQQLLDQRKKLNCLIKSMNEGVDNKKETIFVKRKNHNTLTVGIFKSSKDISTPSRYFHDNLNEHLKTLQMADNTGTKKEDVSLQPCNSSNKQDITSAQPPNAVEQLESTLVVDDRVCPICQQPFDSNIPQADFEEHVCNHLEAESVSLLEQYVVL